MTGYPPARRLDLIEDLPADSPLAQVADPYRWLEDENSPETATWLTAQEELFQRERAGWPLTGHFAGRIQQLIDVGYNGAPVHRSETDRVFSTRRLPGAEHAQLLVAEHGGPPRVLLDPMAIDPSGATTLDAYQPSKEGSLLAYQLSVGGTEESALRVLDVATGELIDGPIERTRYSPVAWLRGEQAFYYVRRLPAEEVPEGEAQYHRRVYLHRLGSPASADVEIFGSGRNKTSYYGVSVTYNGRWLVLSASEGTDPRNDVWLADLEAGPLEAPALRPVVTGADARTSVTVGRDGRLYVFTDLDAPRGRLSVSDPASPEPESWRDLLPEHPEQVLEDYLVLDRGQLADSPLLVATWTRHATSLITLHDPATGEQLAEVDLPGVGSVGGLIGRPEGGDETWFGYSDYATASQVLHLDGVSREVSVWARPPAEVEVPEVRTRQVAFTSRDGTTVRMFVLARADAVNADGDPLTTAPAILYGYGGFGHTMSPGYSAGILSWVEAGGVYAVAGLRGGNEEGEQWHRDGMLAAKQNVFDDFHAAATALIEGGWTTPGQLGIQGGSNGGLLVGAAMTQWPEQFAAVVCSAPLLDMVRYQLHGLGVSWTGEYGDAEDPEQLRWLLGYSPYHRVVAGTDYPATLFTVFAGDTRVDPLHAAKTAAALQHATSADPSEAPIILRREVGVGHGARAISKSVALSSDSMGFLAHHTGLRDVAES